MTDFSQPPQGADAVGRRTAAALAITATVAFAAVAFLDGRVVEGVAGREGLVEWVGAAAFVAAAFVCGARLLRGTGAPWPYLLLWIVLCLLFAGEEISWGQHLFGFDTPEAVRALNKQGEFNLHNLEILHGKNWVHALQDGEWDWDILLGAPNLFRTGFLVYFVLLPLIIRWKPARSALRRLQFPDSGRALALSVIWIMSVSIVMALFVEDAARSRLSETREMYYGLIILTYSVFGLRGTTGQAQGAVDQVDAVPGGSDNPL